MSELLGAKSEEYSGWSRKVQPIFIFFLILFLTVCCFALSWRRATGFTLTSTEHYSTKHLWIRCSGWMYICAIISSLRFKNAVRIITSRPNTGTACSIFTIELRLVEDFCVLSLWDIVVFSVLHVIVYSHV